MTSQPLAKVPTFDDDKKDATVLAMEAFKLPLQCKAMPTPAKAANHDDDLEDFWDNVPV